MRIQYSGNLTKDILASKGMTESDIYISGIEYDVPNVRQLDEFLAFNPEIVIFADCDVDGLCAAAICKSYFERFEGYTVHYKIASRDRRGFQLEDVKEIIKDWPNTSGILTVDCGITSVDAVNFANSHEIDVLVTDHHEPQAELPDCSIINPKLDNRNIFKDFCGAALIYLCFKQLEGENEEALQYAAIATVADLMPLLKDNRYLVQQGLRLINNPTRISKKLKQFFNLNSLIIRTAKDIGWGIGPLINSASRLGEEHIALDAFVFGETSSLERLKELNKLRKTLVDSLYAQADNIQLTPHAASIYVETEHTGILGLLAIKLYSTFGLPSIAYGKISEDRYAFSIRGEGAIDFLTSIMGEETQGGGHDEAAGFSSQHGRETIDRFYEWYRIQYEQAGGNMAMFDRQANDGIYNTIDIPFSTIISRLGVKSRLEPFGQHFSDPIFGSRVIINDLGRTTSGKYNKYSIVGMDGDDNNRASAIFYDFNNIILSDHVGKLIDIEYTIGYSSYNKQPVVDIVNIKNGGDNL